MKELLNAPPVAPVFTRCATGETTEHTNTSCAPYVMGRNVCGVSAIVTGVMRVECNG